MGELPGPKWKRLDSDLLDIGLKISAEQQKVEKLEKLVASLEEERDDLDEQAVSLQLNFMVVEIEKDNLK